MKTLRLYNNILGWSVFVIATIVYFLTLEPTTSFWDCGEFIASAYKLQVGHPPGAPFITILERVFMMVPFVTNLALRVNTLSVLSSAVFDILPVL